MDFKPSTRKDLTFSVAIYFNRLAFSARQHKLAEFLGIAGYAILHNSFEASTNLTNHGNQFLSGTVEMKES